MFFALEHRSHIASRHFLIPHVPLIMSQAMSFGHVGYA